MTQSIKFFILSLFSITLFTACSSEDNTPSCQQVSDVYFSTEATSIYINFSNPENANSFKIEYGPSGFTIGSGTIVTTSNNGFQIENLNPSTTYDIYITSVCSSQDQSTPKGILSVTTNPSQCQVTPTINVSQSSNSYIDLYFNANGVNVDKFEIEYGLAGFTLGSGTVIISDESSVSINQIQPSTTYDFYVRTKCYGNDYSPYAMVQHTTLENCPKPYSLSASSLGGSCTSYARSYNFSWHFDSSNATNFTISVPLLGNTPASGTQFTTSNQSIIINNFDCQTRDFYVRTNCNDNSSSAWAGPFTFN